jgi:hypothetical protein
VSVHEDEFSAHADAVVSRAIDEPWGLTADIAGGPDVEADARRFGRQYRYFSLRDLAHPCLVPDDGDPIPLDAGSVVGPEWAPRFELPRELGAEINRHIAEMGADLAERSQVRFAELHPDEARSSFGRRLARFLAARFVGSADPSPQAVAGLPFTVHTNSNGLRVHYSPAYWWSPRSFGSPTSPVARPMRPGRYVFGADGPHLALQFDATEYDLPPDTSARLYV